MIDPRETLARIRAQVDAAADVAPGSILHALTSTTHAPALLAAVEGMMGLHQPERRYMPYEGADVSYDTPEEAAADMEYDDGGVLNDVHHFDLCAHCKVIEDSPCDGECTREAGYLASLWPCPTIRAITAALEAA